MIACDSADHETALDRVRSSRRHRFVLSMLVRIANYGDSVELPCSNISINGAFLRTDLLFEVGTPIWCEVSLPTGATFSTSARVARVVECRDGADAGMGVIFDRYCEALPAY